MLTASCAKINLFLELTGKLPNNYHQVDTVLCSIDLFDYLDYEVIDSPQIVLSCNINQLANENNLIYKVASYLQNEYKIPNGISIKLKKLIPIAAGLGGGSSNAANCILALNKLWQLHLSKAEMHKIAAQFGSDINFFLEGGTARGENRGEIITKMPDIILNNILLINPGIAISSAEAYKLAYLTSKQEQHYFDIKNVYSSCFNRLEAGIRKAYPIVDEVINTLKQYEAKVSMLSGSGSTCFGIFENIAQLEKCKDYFSEKGFWTYRAKTINSDNSIS